MRAIEKVNERQRATAPVVTIRLLGRFAVEVDGRAIPDTAWRGQKVRALVKLLALAPAGRLARDQLLDLLWPDFAPEAAASNLYTTLTAARRALAPATVQLRAGIIALPAEPLPQIDVVAFREAAALARGAADPVAYEKALALYGGDLLPDDRYDDWATGPREVLRETFHGLLRGLAERQVARGERAAAIGTLDRLVAADPIDEAAHGELMRLHAVSGNRAAALRQFAAAREHLARELDAEPGAELRRLNAAIIAGQVAMVPDPPPAVPSPTDPAPPDAPVYRLPTPLTAFFGRADDLIGVGALLAEEAVRLVTLTGVGGTGKTRLALALARERHVAHPDRVCFVELAGVVAAEGQAAAITSVVAAALRVRDRLGEALETTLVAALGTRTLLLVLDNCEHIVDGVAELAATLLAGCPRLQILATSREALRLPGEVTWIVPPLPLPEDAGDDAASLAANPAVGLFIDRARRRQPGFVPDAETLAGVVAICRRLDGLPLALELAAARLGVLTLGEITARLDDLLDTLVTRDRGLPARQQTMRAALDWSYGLLSPAEQRFFRHLAPFVGTWPLAAAVAANPDSAGEGPTLELLEGLVDKSLVRAAPDGVISRYRLLEPVRQYAAARLAEANESRAAHERHVAYCLALVGGADDGMSSAARGDWLARLDREGATVRAALDWLLAEARATEGLIICGEVWRHWSARGRYEDARRWSAAFLDLAREDGSAADALLPFIRTLFGSGILAREQGDYATAQEHFERVLLLSRAHNVDQFIAGSLTQLANILQRTGDFAMARRYHHDALTVRRAAGDRWGEAISLIGLGNCAVALGDPDGGLRFLQQALAILRALGDPAQLTSVLYWIGLTLTTTGDLAAARSYLTEGIALGETSGLHGAYIGCLVRLGEVAIQEDRLSEAQQHLNKALDVIERAGVWSEFAACLRGFAALAVATGDRRCALRLAAVASRTDVAQGIVRTIDAASYTVALLTAARAALAPETIAILEADGARLTTPAAIAEARAVSIA